MAIAWEALIEADRRRSEAALLDDYEHLGRQLARRGMRGAARSTRWRSIGTAGTGSNSRRTGRRMLGAAAALSDVDRYGRRPVRVHVV
jgi:hypothetical protein